MNNTTNLTAGNFYFVSGKVNYSMLTRQCTDEEREASNNRTGNFMGANYYTLSLTDATVMVDDENNPTPEQQYAKSNCYTSKDGVTCYRGYRFSSFKPDVYIKNDDTGEYDKVDLTREIPKGVPVKVAFQVYESNSRLNVSIYKVFVDEDFRKKSCSSFTTQLKKLGIVISQESYGKED